MELRPIDGGSGKDEIEAAVTAFARKPNGGLIVTATPMANIHRELIIALAERHRLPAVYGFRFHVERGGLILTLPISLTSTDAQQVTSIASSRARNLPTCLCRHRPSSSWSINLKTAKALGLTVPPTLLARADEVIE